MIYKGMIEDIGEGTWETIETEYTLYYEHGVKNGFFESKQQLFNEKRIYLDEYPEQKYIRNKWLTLWKTSKRMFSTSAIQTGVSIVKFQTELENTIKILKNCENMKDTLQ